MVFAERYVIEVDDEAVGLVVGELSRRGVVFHATHPRLMKLEGVRFASTQQALRQAQTLLRQANDSHPSRA